MTGTGTPQSGAADHIEETLRSISQLRADHDGSATPLQRGMDRVTAALGRPLTIVVIAAVVSGWIGANVLAAALGAHPLDPPPFAWLGEGVSLAALFVVALILTTQRREDELARRRELLILELVILGEQKSAKVIQLLEEYRRDNPFVKNRPDQVADTMAQPADPNFVLDVMKRPQAPAGNKPG